MICPEPHLRDSLSKSSPIHVYGCTATRLDTSTSCTSCVEANTISLELAWKWREAGGETRLKMDLATICYFQERNRNGFVDLEEGSWKGLWTKWHSSFQETSLERISKLWACKLKGFLVISSHTWNTAYLIDSKSHDYVRLLMNDFSFSSWVAQICLHLESQENTKHHG